MYKEKKYPGHRPPASSIGCARYEKSPAFKGGKRLRSYQLEGLNWLVFSWYHKRNCVLADEMGLGKTIQSISFFNHIRTRELVPFPCLVVAPLSTLQHWRREVEDWTELNPVVYHTQGGESARRVIRAREFYYHDARKQERWVMFH